MIPICRKKPDHNSEKLWIDFLDPPASGHVMKAGLCVLTSTTKWFSRDKKAKFPRKSAYYEESDPNWA
jgi:hypothetical protein